MFLEKLIEVAERFSLSEVNRQIVINSSTDEAKGLASIFSLNFRDLYETLMMSCLCFVLLYFEVPTKTITCFSACTLVAMKWSSLHATLHVTRLQKIFIRNRNPI